VTLLTRIITPIQINAVVSKTLAFKPKAILLIMPPCNRINRSIWAIYGGENKIQDNSASNKTSLFYYFIGKGGD